MQRIITPEDNYIGLDKWLIGKKKVLLVCGESLKYLNDFNRKLKEISTPIIRFSDFQPNPLYESVVAGVKVFRDEECDAIIAAGGGSAIDVAKCIKSYINQPRDGTGGEWLKQVNTPNSVPFLVMPTTAGSGSEATRYAVIYYEGEKQSITDSSLIPETVLMDAGVLKSLPGYQRKAAMCDALCHAVESFWSVNSNEESEGYSREAIRAVIKYMDGYLANTDEGNRGMLLAAYTAGKAINITQTTAGHAMCYKITSLYNVAHGHAAILCDRVLYPWMINNVDKTTDPRGEEHLKNVLCEIGRALGCEDAVSGANRLENIFESLGLSIPEANSNHFEELKCSVNSTRLKNHPMCLDEKMIDRLYHRILR